MFHFITAQFRKIMGLGVLVALAASHGTAHALVATQSEQRTTAYTSVAKLAGGAVVTAPDTTKGAVLPQAGTPGKTYTVSKSGQLKAAVAKLRAGDTLVLKEGTYKGEAISFAYSGTKDKYITVQGVGNVVIDGSNLGSYTPVFNTNGKDYIKFKGLTVKNARSAISISSGSQHIVIEQLKSDKNQMAVYAAGASFVTIRDAVATNSRNAFRFEKGSHDILIDDVNTSGSKDIYPGYSKDYLNGDGFIFESDTYNITIKNTVSYNHWDAGFDIKGSNVRLDNVVAYGNKNGLKLWGKNVIVNNARIYNNKKQRMTKGGYVDGNGLNMRSGSAKFYNSAFWGNEDINVKVGTKTASVTLTDTTISGAGKPYYVASGGKFVWNK